MMNLRQPSHHRSSPSLVLMRVMNDIFFVADVGTTTAEEDAVGTNSLKEPIKPQYSRGMGFARPLKAAAFLKQTLQGLLSNDMAGDSAIQNQLDIYAQFGFGE